MPVDLYLRPGEVDPTVLVLRERAATEPGGPEIYERMASNAVGVIAVALRRRTAFRLAEDAWLEVAMASRLIGVVRVSAEMEGLAVTTDARRLTDVQRYGSLSLEVTSEALRSSSFPRLLAEVVATMEEELDTRRISDRRPVEIALRVRELIVRLRVLESID